MPRKPAWPPVPAPHRSGQARVRVGGKDHYLGVWGTPEVEENLAALVAAEESRREAGRAALPPSGPAVADAVECWAAEELPLLPAQAQANYRRALTVLVRLFGDLPAAGLDADRLEEVQRAMASGSWLTPEDRKPLPPAPSSWVKERGPRRKPRWRNALTGRVSYREPKGGKRAAHLRRPGPWNRKVVNRAVSRIKTVWRWVEKRRLVPKGSWANLCLLKSLPKGSRHARPEPKRRVPTDGEIVRIALSMPRSIARLMLLVQLWSGMRSGEVRRMLWSEIDRAGEVWVYRPAEHKNAWRGQSREVALGPRCVAVLKLARKREPHGDLVFPCRRSGRGPVLGPYTAGGYGGVCHQAAKRVGVEGFRPYLARHRCKMRLTKLYGLDVARCVLGQKCLDSTDSYGDTLDLDTARKAAKKAG